MSFIIPPLIDSATRREVEGHFDTGARIAAPMPIPKEGSIRADRINFAPFSLDVLPTVPGVVPGLPHSSVQAFKPSVQPERSSVQSGEVDPTGRNPHEPGAKLDAGKNRLGLVLGDFARALRAVGKVGSRGAQKYSAHGWIDVPNGIERYTDALYRHLLAEAAGEARDQETQLLHAAHAAWNALARLDLLLREIEGPRGGRDGAAG